MQVSAALEKNDYPQLLKFFENLLRHDSPCRLEDEYPLVFHPHCLEQLIIFREGDEIHAGLGTLVRDIEIREGENSRMMFVGSVVTAPEHRNQGLQRRLFVELDRRAQAEDVDFIVLWSNKLEFYKKLGFMLGGLQATWIPKNKNPLSEKEIDVKLAKASEIQLSKAHFEAFSKKKMRVNRSFEEMQRLFKIPQMQVAYTDNAYALLGKGEDFKQVCHEWAGPSDEVMACIDRLRQEAEYFRVISPGVLNTENEQDVVAAFEKADFDSRMEFLGLFRAVSHRYPEAGLDPHNLRYPFFIWGLDSI